MRRLEPGRVRTQREGFVLMGVLALLLVAALLSANVASRSMQRVLQSHTAERDLQLRWGRQSMRRAILPRSEELLAREAILLPQDSPIREHGRLSAQIRLSGQLYEITLSDEEAKVNLNRILAVDGKTETIRCIRKLRNETSRLPVEIRPASVSSSGFSKPRLQSWGEVFSLGSGVLRESNSIPQSVRDATQEMTLWGSGRLNLRRASDAAVRVVCDSLLNERQIQQLLEQRRENPLGSVEEWLAVLALSPEERRRIQQRLSVQSQAYSLWILPQDDGRGAAELVVRQQTGSGSGNSLRFLW